MPSWLAPNVITLIGFIAIYINVFEVLIYMPDLTSEAPYWLYYTFGLGLLFYQTMDNIDGKQARRTGSSSPLGELFDHGIDSLNCCLAGLIETACMGVGSTGLGAFLCFCSCIGMYMSTWETFHTDVLYLGYLNGPTEGIVLAAAVMASSGVWGPQIWQENVVDLFPGTAKYVPATFSMSEAWAWFVFATIVVIHAPACIYNVYQAKKLKKESFVASLYELTPLGVTGLALYCWISSPYATVLTNNHLVLFVLTLSFVFGRMTTSIILAHLTKQPYPWWSLPQVPLVIGSLVFGLFPRFHLIQPLSSTVETVYLWSYFAYAVTYFMGYSQLIIDTLCEFLDINCYTIKKKVV